MYRKRTTFRLNVKGWKMRLKLSLGIGLFRIPKFYQDSNLFLHEFKQWALITPFFEITWWNFKTEYEI